MNYHRYANVETNLFPEIALKFSQDGSLDPVDFWAILVWKANRSKSKLRRRLTEDGRTFSESVRGIANSIYNAPAPKDKLGALMVDWRFRLPTAIAILTVLYPDEFTVYDYRVCEQLNAFRELKNRRFSDDLWDQYQEFKFAVINAAPDGATLRDADHYLWGRSWHEDARRDIGLANDAVS